MSPLTVQESESSESLDEAEKAEIAMLKGQSERASAMEQALRTMSSIGTEQVHHSVLIKDLNAAESELTEQALIRQKKEMQRQMAQLMMESRNSVRSSQTPSDLKVIEPETNGPAVTDQAEHDVAEQTEH